MGQLGVLTVFRRGLFAS